MGATLLAGLVAWVGPRILLQQMITLGWVLPLLVLLGFAKNVIRSLTWREALRAEGVRLPLISLFQARVASQSLAYVSSMGSALADPSKAWILRRYASVADTLGATLIEAAAYWFTSLVVITCGTFTVVLLSANQTNGLTLALLLGTIFVLVFRLLTATDPVLRRLTDRLSHSRRVPAKWILSLRRAEETERQMRSFRLRRPQAMRRMLALDFLVQGLTIGEVWLVLSSLAGSVGLFAVILVDTAARASKALSFYIPGRVGADEVAAMGAVVAAGLEASEGLTLSLARRLQGLFWAVLGLLWLRFDAPPRHTDQSSPQAVVGALRSRVVSEEGMNHASVCCITQD